MAGRDKMALVEQVIDESIALGLGLLTAEGEATSGRHVRVSGRDLIQFGSCSYLGLELDERVVAAAVEAVRAHGVQFCSSRSYLSSPLYAEFEALVEQIFECPTVVTPTTTLGHLSSIPVLVGADDAILLDHQVHASVQMAARLASTAGTRVKLVPHNDLARLEERIAFLSRRHPQVWYMADGIYSMFGDRAPIAALVEMLERQPSMRLFVDDAHGMSWCGPRGAGSVFEATAMHPRMVVATGLGKGFGTGGGLVVLPDEAQRDRVKRIGPTMIFAGPLQPPVLGGAIASARIHLSDEIGTLQRALRDRIAFVHRAFVERGLPIVSPPDTPVGFVGAGALEACRILVRRLMDDGYYVNPAQFPAAPLEHSGLRFLVTLHQTEADLEGLADACARHWRLAIEASGQTPESVCERFGLEPTGACRPPSPRAPAPTAAPALVLERASSIGKLDAGEWDRTAGGAACLASNALRVFEAVFDEAAGPENHWRFHYYVVRDASGEPVLATVFTSALWKADMLAPAEVSRAVEAKRRRDPLHLTQRVMGQGCLLSEGPQLWLRGAPDGGEGRAALALLIEAVRADAEAERAEMIVFRDVPASDDGLSAAYQRADLLRMPTPTAHVLEPVPASDEALVAGLSRDHRRHHRRAVAPHRDAYHVEVRREASAPPSAATSGVLQALYENVRSRRLDLNTYPIPATLWAHAATAPGWELVLLRPREAPEADPVGFFVACDAPSGYVPLVVGLDYEHVERAGLYRQVLATVVERARARDAERILLGFGAPLEKRRLGARPVEASMFVEIIDPSALLALEAAAEPPPEAPAPPSRATSERKPAKPSPNRTPPPTA